MITEYQRLLDAAIEHLLQLKRQGQRFVQVSPEVLAALSRPVPLPVLSQTARTVAAIASGARVAMAKAEPAPSSSDATVAGTRGTTKARQTGGKGSETLGRASAPAPTASAAPSDKAKAMEALRRQALACKRCPHLVATRTQVVFGVGNIDADLMFVGEAPGADEDRQGEPFVGAAGQLLTKVIETMGLSRDQVYIANILKCRPDVPPGTSGNRKPRPDEMRTCLPWLEQQIDIIQPKVLVALGATAVEGLLGRTQGITKLRGTWQSYRGIPLMPTFHPAYLLYNPSLQEKRKLWEDMLQVMERLGLKITAKHRGYFLKR